MTRILVVDDEPDMCWAISTLLRQEKYDVDTASRGDEALEKFKNHPWDLVVLDVRLPDRSGLDLLKELKTLDAETAVLMLTAYNDVPTVVTAIKNGAADYVTKPFQNEEFLLSVRKALDQKQLVQKVRVLQNVLREKQKPQPLLGDSDAMKTVRSLTEQVAPTNYTVLIEGESGTGKEVVAHRLHALSRRADGPFVALDCGAIPESLVESELFGHEKGAFTSADAARPGKMEAAQGGTLFLDEIGNLPLPAQATLLRVLQDKQLTRLGGQRPISLDVRLIVATNSELRGAAEAGRFRQDLYHRLSEFVLALRPLRERVEDVPALAEHFLKQAEVELAKRFRGFTPDALAFLKRFAWPGNVRELKNAVRRAALLARSDVLDAPDFLFLTDGRTSPVPAPPPLAPSPSLGKGGEAGDGKQKSRPRYRLKKASKQAASEVEKQLIKEVLLKTKYNKTKAARLLGIDRKALYYKMRLFKL